MENHFFDTVISALAPLIEEQGFALQDDGSYLNEGYRFLVEFDEEGSLYSLKLSPAGEEAQYAVVSSWRFNEEKGEKEAATIGNDFLDTLRTKLGLNTNRKSFTQVQLPAKKASGKNDIEAFCSRMLAIFPKYKDTYRQHIADNGEFLYITFFSETVVLDVREALDSKNKKQLKKLFDALAEAYVEGDRTVQNIVAITVVMGAIAGNTERFETAVSYLSDCPYLKSAVTELNKAYKTNKKLKKMIG